MEASLRWGRDLRRKTPRVVTTPGTWLPIRWSFTKAMSEVYESANKDWPMRVAQFGVEFITSLIGTAATVAIAAAEAIETYEEGGPKRGHTRENDSRAEKGQSESADTTATDGRDPAPDGHRDVVARAAEQRPREIALLQSLDGWVMCPADSLEITPDGNEDLGVVGDAWVSSDMTVDVEEVA